MTDTEQFTIGRLAARRAVAELSPRQLQRAIETNRQLATTYPYARGFLVGVDDAIASRTPIAKAVDR